MRRPFVIEAYTTGLGGKWYTVANYSTGMSALESIEAMVTRHGRARTSVLYRVYNSEEGKWITFYRVHNGIVNVAYVDLIQYPEILRLDKKQIDESEMIRWSFWASFGKPVFDAIW